MSERAIEARCVLADEEHEDSVGAGPPHLLRSRRKVGRPQGTKVSPQIAPPQRAA